MINELTYSELIKKVHETLQHNVETFHERLQHKSIFINKDTELLNLENGLSIAPMVFDTECNYLYFAVRVEFFEKIYFNINKDTFYSYYDDDTSIVCVFTNDVSNKLSRKLNRIYEKVAMNEQQSRK